MLRRKHCRKKSKCGASLIGPMLVALGIGIFLANIIPTYVLIVMLGIALIAAGIWFITK